MLKFAITPVLVLLAACQGNRVDPDAGSNAQNEAAAANPNSAVLERARSALRAVLVDDSQVRYEEVRSVPGGAICGRIVRGGQAASDALPFVVTPAGEGFLGRSARLTLEDLSDPFPDIYMRWCSSIEELRALQLEAEAMAQRNGIVDDPDANADDIPLARDTVGDSDPPVHPAVPPSERDQSFLNAVRRPDR